MIGRLREAGTRVRKVVGSKAVIGSFTGLSRLGALTPLASPRLHGVEVVRDLAYTPAGERDPTYRLDVYRPRETGGEGQAALRPAVLYLHGGAFRFLSKDTHWLMGLLFARHGYVVFNANYRLAPAHRYPAALEDAVEAALWVRENAARFGADPDRLIVTGDSAGANLAAALMVMTCYARPEPFARRLYDAELRFRAVVPACGVLQVTDPQRFSRRRRLTPWVADRLHEVAEGYLPPGVDTHEGAPLADPLVLLERGAPDRPLPPVFAFAGTADPLLDDTRRLKRAVDARGGRCEARYYRGGLHAFHALIWDPNAWAAWKAKLAFLERFLAEHPGALA